MGGIGIWQILIILVIVLLLFGTKKLRNIGGDLGSSIKSFKKAMSEGEKEAEKDAEEKVINEEPKGRVIENEDTKEKNKV